MHTLITWTDRPTAVSTKIRVGARKNPILSLVRHPSSSFERVLLMYTSSVSSGTKQLAVELRDLELQVRLVLCPVEDTGAYTPWFHVMSDLMGSMDTRDTFGLISAGPPAARAAWLALHALGMFRGSLVQIREGRIHPVDLALGDVAGGDTNFVRLRDGVKDIERRMILQSLQQTGNNLLQTSKQLEIDRNTLKRKMGQLGIDRPKENS